MVNWKCISAVFSVGWECIQCVCVCVGGWVFACACVRVCVCVVVRAAGARGVCGKCEVCGVFVCACVRVCVRLCTRTCVHAVSGAHVMRGVRRMCVVCACASVRGCGERAVCDEGCECEGECGRQVSTHRATKKEQVSFIPTHPPTTLYINTGLVEHWWCSLQPFAKQNLVPSPRFRAATLHCAHARQLHRISLVWNWTVALSFSEFGTSLQQAFCGTPPLTSQAFDAERHAFCEGSWVTSSLTRVTRVSWENCQSHSLTSPLLAILHCQHLAFFVAWTLFNQIGCRFR